jgi:DNA-binding NtrC family response regulator
MVNASKRSLGTIACPSALWKHWETLLKLEEAHIKLTLERLGGNRKQVAGMLGISLRTQAL